MNCIIPFTKDIKFKTNIGEILSLSLEHEHTANSSEILGNFIITGDYKTHEVSISKEHFEYVLPFSVDLSTRIDIESVDFSIEDFTYSIVDNDTLRVNIEYSVNAMEVREEDKTLEELLDELDYNEEREEPIEEIKEIEEENILEVKEEIKEEKIVEVSDVNSKEKKEENVEEVKGEREIDKETEDTVISSIIDTEEVFVTYNIHIMQEVDTIESICMKYNTSQDILSEYNDLNSIAVGDKLIIPSTDE